MQEIPRFDQQVEVDPDEKDFWGIPVARLLPSKIETDLEGGKFMSEKAELWLKEAGANFTWRSPGTSRGLAPCRTRQAHAEWVTIPKLLLQINMAAFIPYLIFLYQMPVFM